MHDLSEREANRVVSRLQQAQVSASKVSQADGRWAISVPRDSVINALRFLDTQRTFSPREESVSASNRSSILPSRKDQWFRYERSLAGSIEESLLSIPGVLEAHVHLNLPEDDPLFGNGQRGQGTGSVLLLVGEGCAARDEEIAALVGGAAGIAQESVRVLRSSAESAERGEVQAVSQIEPPPEQPPGQKREAVPPSNETRPVSWIEVAVVLASLIGVVGARRILAQRGPTVFSLPKELDFES